MRILIKAVACATVVACGEQSDGNQHANQVEPAIKSEMLVSSDQVPRPCGDSGLTTNDLMAISGSVELRDRPSRDGNRIVNEKASSILGRTHYHVVDSSTTVRQVCHEARWSEVQIVEPSWLTHVRGWVPNTALREIQRDTGGNRILVDEDFLWDRDTRPYKAQIITAVNRIARENRRCRRADPASVAKSPSRSRPGRPVFFVTCNEGAEAFNVWFEPSEAGAERRFTEIENIDQANATRLCEAAARNAATHSSTVDFSRMMDASFTQHASGRSRLISTFTAKNSFNLELRFRVSCLFEGSSLIETLIAEDGS